MNKAEARAFRRKIEKAASAQTDEDALASIDLYPHWKDGLSVAANERYQFNGRLYKVLQPHNTQADWTPDVAVSLFVEVSVEEWPEIPEVITAENAFMSGDKVTFEGKHYICQMDGCTWSPSAYPAAWQLVG